MIHIIRGGRIHEFLAGGTIISSCHQKKKVFIWKKVLSSGKTIWQAKKKKKHHLSLKCFPVFYCFDQLWSQKYHGQKVRGNLGITVADHITVTQLLPSAQRRCICFSLSFTHYHLLLVINNTNMHNFAFISDVLGVIKLQFFFNNFCWYSFRWY